MSNPSTTTNIGAYAPSLFSTPSATSILPTNTIAHTIAMIPFLASILFAYGGVGDRELRIPDLRRHFSNLPFLASHIHGRIEFSNLLTPEHWYHLFMAVFEEFADVITLLDLILCLANQPRDVVNSFPTEIRIMSLYDPLWNMLKSGRDLYRAKVREGGRGNFQSWTPLAHAVLLGRFAPGIYRHARENLPTLVKFTQPAFGFSRNPVILRMWEEGAPKDMDVFDQRQEIPRGSTRAMAIVDGDLLRLIRREGSSSRSSETKSGNVTATAPIESDANNDGDDTQFDEDDDDVDEDDYVEASAADQDTHKSPFTWKKYKGKKQASKVGGGGGIVKASQDKIAQVQQSLKAFDVKQKVKLSSANATKLGSHIKF